MKVISLKEFKEKRQERAEKAVYEHIREDMGNLEYALELVTSLPKTMQVRLVKYCLTHFVSLSDLTDKHEENV